MTQELAISRIMQTGLLQCSPQTPLNEAAARMAERHCSSILVMENARPVGIWTEHDALAMDFTCRARMQRPIADCMSTPVATIEASASVEEATWQLGSQNCRHLLVMRQGTPVGIVTQTDIALNQGVEPYLRLREVRAAMRATPLILSGDRLLADAAETMQRHAQDALIVLCDPHAEADGGSEHAPQATPHHRELGILTERDMVRFIARYPGNTAIAELASRPLHSIEESAPLLQARDRLLDHRIRHLAVLTAEGNISGLLGFRDMLAGAERLYLKDLRAALEQRDSALARSRRHLQLAEKVIDSSLEGIIITDPDARIEFVNPAFTHMTGYQLEDVIGRTPGVLSSGRHDAAFYRDMWDAIRQQGFWRGEVWNRRKSGELYLELLTITAIRDDEGRVQHYAGLFTDITHIRENEQRIRHLAYYDPLTRLPNRRLLDDRIALAIRHAHRAGSQLAVVFIDLDHFKQVNDTLGHALGDELLLQVARRMQQNLREDDTLARLGGDEFIALLTDITTFDEATRIAQRLIDTVSAPFCIERHTFRIGCSLGISLYPEDGDAPETLIQRADAAMYRAKHEGRNTYRLYRSDVDAQARHHLTLETDLRNLLEEKSGLAMHYQPLYCRDSGNIASAEALVRWQHPEYGMVSPGEFIPLAERSGLILPLGERIIDLVISDMQRWQQAGLPLVPVAINLSAAQFWQAGFTEHVAAKFTDAGIASSLIVFELTESMLLNKHGQGIAILRALCRHGFRIALDDFGTGYSSLSYLQNIPAHSLKIDRSFIVGLDQGTAESRAIVRAIASLARELGLAVVAEGVETETQWEQLGEHAIDLVQGFYLARPMPEEAFARRLAALDSVSSLPR